VADSGQPWTTLRATQFHDAFLICGAGDGKAASDAGPGQLPVPAGRRGRGGGPARGTDARHAGRAGARHDLAAGVRDGQPARRITPGRSPAPADRAGPDPGQAARTVQAGAVRTPERGCGSPDLGRLPGRPGSERRPNGRYSPVTRMRTYARTRLCQRSSMVWGERSTNELQASLSRVAADKAEIGAELRTASPGRSAMCLRAAGQPEGRYVPGLQRADTCHDLLGTSPAKPNDNHNDREGGRHHGRRVDG
jgi:hypothetical protein